MTSVLIGYCHNGTVRAEFHGCLIGLMLHEAKRGKLKNLQRCNVGGAYIAQNRNIIAENFLATDFEWLLFLDNDMVFNGDLLKLLLESADANAKTPVVAWLVRGPDGKLGTIPEVDCQSIIPLAACGMGGTIIHRDVFLGIRAERASRGIKPEDDDWEWFGHDLDHGQRMGEDVTFCLRAAAAGFATYGVGSIQLGHVKARHIDLSVLKDNPAALAMPP